MKYVCTNNFIIKVNYVRWLIIIMDGIFAVETNKSKINERKQSLNVTFTNHNRNGKYVGYTW